MKPWRKNCRRACVWRTTECRSRWSMATRDRLREPRIWLWLVAAASFIWLPPATHGDELAKRVVIVYNAEDPDSRPLADYYASKRGVPTNQICGISIRVSETITRQEFKEKIHDPIWR